MSSLINVQPNKRVLSLSGRVVGVYGRAGIGKSTLASMFDGVYFCATEAGLAHIDGVYKTNVTTWAEFLYFCKEFTETEHKFKTLCIDTFDNLCQLCTENKCKELDIDEIADYKKFGAYHLVTQDLQRVITKLSLQNFGLILTSHYKEEEMTSKTQKWNRATISVTGRNKDIMLNICDPLLFMDSKMEGDKEVGVIRTKPSIYWEAKDKSQALPEEIIYPVADIRKAHEIIKKAFSE